MFEQLTDRVAQKATETAQTAAIGLGAVMFLSVGSIFLGVAAWLFLMTLTSALIACLIMGCVFFGVGMILIAVLSMRSRAIKRRRIEEALQAKASQTAQLSVGLSGLLGIVTAFINGMNAAKKSRS